MRYITIFLIAILLIGCQTQEEMRQEREAEVYKQEQIRQIKEAKIQEERRKIEEQREHERLERERNASVLNQMGISMDNGKFIFDTNMAKEFFSSLANNLKDKNATIAKDSGIDVQEHNLTIDLNKTKAFLEHWSSKMESFAREISSFGEKIDDNNLSR